MTEIIDGLFLGNFEDARNEPFLSSNRITHILSAAKEISPFVLDKYTYLHIKLKDKENFELTPFLDQAVAFIHKAIKTGGRVLVHCYAGVSRSASLVIAFLIRSKHLQVLEALELCQLKRPVVNPNKGFLEKLTLYSKIEHDPRDSLTPQDPDKKSDSPACKFALKNPMKKDYDSSPNSFNRFFQNHFGNHSFKEDFKI